MIKSLLITRKKAKIIIHSSNNAKIWRDCQKCSNTWLNPTTVEMVTHFIMTKEVEVEVDGKLI